jgi:actin-related protein 5
MKERQKRRTQLGDRKSLAAQNRMKSITSLASDQPAARKKRKKTADDTFGANDADWAVYREIVSSSPLRCER